MGLHDPVHPHGHNHSNHNHKPDDHHNGEAVVSLFLNDSEIAYLNALPLAADIPIPQAGGPAVTPRSLKIKVAATVYPDPDHHHHVHNRGDNPPQGNNEVHEPDHQWRRTSV